LLWLALAAVVVVAGWAGWRWMDRGRSRGTDPGTDDPPAVIKPAEMPGLGYLPESTSAVLAVQLPVLLDRLNPAQKDDPTKALARLGLPEQGIELLESASGVGLKEVDQLVVGISLKDRAFPPQFVVVAYTRRPYDLAALARRTKARELKKNGRTLHVVKTSTVPEVYWWSPNNRVLVATISSGDFTGVPGEPRTGTAGLRPEVASLIRDAVAEDACAWIAASDDEWDKHLRRYTWLPFIPFVAGRTDLIDPAGRLRSVTLSIPQEPERMVDVRIGLKSDAAAEELETKLADRFHGEPIDVSRAAETVRIQTPFQPARLGSVIGRLVPAK
jgi:hypothetical protein